MNQSVPGSNMCVSKVLIILYVKVGWQHQVHLRVQGQLEGLVLRFVVYLYWRIGCFPGKEIQRTKISHLLHFLCCLANTIFKKDNFFKHSLLLFYIVLSHSLMKYSFPTTFYNYYYWCVQKEWTYMSRGSQPIKK